ncbi:MAG: GTP 3',8-cyclase MoaA [Candidatus Omnitrophica bacterium]|nr:GTP 3',8-cyclase MoaA [Candidatus Omnitrophota bacterium]
MVKRYKIKFKTRIMRDKFGREIDTLRISVTDRCNFSCLYCSKEFNKIEKEKILSYEEIINIVKVFTKLGIKKIKLTGGEPLIRENITYLIKEISNLPEIEDISLTTNGFFLFENVEKIKEAGIKRINISLDTLDEKKFARITGFKHLDRIKRVVEESCKTFSSVKLNVVIIKNINLNEIEDFLNFARENKMILKFIELMPVYKNLSFWKENFVPYKVVKNIIESFVSIFKIEERRIKVYKGENLIVEFVSPVSEPFCGKCDRLRIDCKGDLFLCLYGKPVLNLKKFNEEILNLIQFYIFNREYSFNPFAQISVKNYRFPVMNCLGG